MQKSTVRQFAVCIGAAVIALSTAVAGAEVTNGIRCEVHDIGNTWMSTSVEDLMVWIFMDASQHGVSWRHLAVLLMPILLFLVWFVVDKIVDIALHGRTCSVDKMQHKEGN